jgi:hypothetical protein
MTRRRLWQGARHHDTTPRDRLTTMLKPKKCAGAKYVLELQNGLTVIDPCAYATRAQAVEASAEMVLDCGVLKAE